MCTLQFRGAYHFQYSLKQLASLAYPYHLSYCEIEVHASIGERFIDVIVDGFSKARIVNDSITITILGDKPLIFKPHMEFYVYVIRLLNCNIYYPKRCTDISSINRWFKIQANGKLGRMCNCPLVVLQRPYRSSPFSIWDQRRVPVGIIYKLYVDARNCVILAAFWTKTNFYNLQSVRLWNDTSTTTWVISTVKYTTACVGNRNFGCTFQSRVNSGQLLSLFSISISTWLKFWRFELWFRSFVVSEALLCTTL